MHFAVPYKNSALQELGVLLQRYRLGFRFLSLCSQSRPSPTRARSSDRTWESGTRRVYDAV